MNYVSLLASIKRRAYVPDNGAEYSDAEILSIADEALLERVLPTYMAVREGFLQQDVSVAVSSGANIQVPARALGAGILMARFQDSSGNLYPLTHIDDSQKVWTAQLTAPVSPATAWYFKGDQLILQPAPPSGSTGYVVVTYTAAPNKLGSDVGTAPSTYIPLACQIITAVDFATSKVTISVDPSTTSLAVNATVDIVSGDASHGYRVFQTVITARTTIAPYTLTLASLPSNSGTTAGDYVCFGALTPIPMIPDALHTLLVLETSRRILDGIADPRAEVVAAEIEEKAPKLLQMVAPRGQNQPKRMINRYSAMRLMRSRGWWYGWQPGSY